MVSFGGNTDPVRARIGSVWNSAGQAIRSLSSVRRLFKWIRIAQGWNEIY